MLILEHWRQPHLHCLGRNSGETVVMDDGPRFFSAISRSSVLYRRRVVVKKESTSESISWKIRWKLTQYFLLNCPICFFEM